MPISFLYFVLYIIFFNLKISFSCQMDKKNDLFKEDFVKSFENKEVAFSIFSERKNVTLFEFGENKSLIPNSIVKILTSYVAFNYLEPSFKFENKLVGYGKITEGVFEGSLQIIASGDPTFGSERFRGLAASTSIIVDALKERGIEKINGEIVIKSPYDESASRPESWPSEDVANYYGCGIYGFNVHDNLFSIEFSIPKKRNETTKILRVFPEIPNLSIENSVKAGDLDKKDRAVIFKKSEFNDLMIKGTLGRVNHIYQIKGAIPDPGVFYLHHLEKSLIEQGITLIKKKVQPNNKIAFSTSFFSPTLEEIVYLMNQESINLYAEALLKKVCFEKTNNSSFESGAHFIKLFLKSQTGDLFELYDGSGLSPLNRLTAKSMINVIKAMSSQKYFENILATLPSTDGKATKLNRLFPEKEFKNKLLAKTGFSSAGESILGICYNKSGERFFFCAIENHLSTSDRALFYSKLKEALCFFCLS